MNSGTEILTILKNQNIKAIKDIDNYSLSNYAELKDFVYGREDLWIGDVFNIIGRDMKQSSEQLIEYSCAMKSHFRKSGNQMSGKWKSSYASLLA